MKPTHKTPCDESKRSVFRKPILLLILLTGIGLTGLLTALSILVTARSLIRSFDKEAGRQTTFLREALDRSLMDMDSLRRLFECTTEVTRDEFQQFSIPILKESPWISAVTWIPEVSVRQRQAFEMQARSDGMEGYYFKEFKTDAGFYPAAARSTYYPVYYLEPFRDYSEWLGVDLGAQAQRLKLLEKSRNLGMPVLQIMKLEEPQSESKEVELFFPVYDRSGVTFTRRGRQNSLRGYCGALLNLNRGVLSRMDLYEPVLSILMEDVTDTNNPVCLLREDSWRSARSRVPFLFQKLQYDEIMPVADRFWRVRCRPGPAYCFGAAVWAPAAVLGVGLCLTGLLWLYLLTLYNRHEVTEELVRTRTAELERQKELADQMAQWAAEANRSKSIFLANMSHEIRTPMSAILGFADLLMDTELKSVQREYVGLIRESGKTLLALINDILDFSKIEAGKLTMEMVDCNLPDLLQSIHRIMEPLATAKHLAFSVEVLGELPVFITGDPVRIRQCLINLVGNAVKFTASGSITLRVAMEIQYGKARIRFEVEDTGIGITPDRIETIFDAFTQSDSSTTRQYGGTGLGLTISQRLAEMMGGSLTVRSELGQGSVFTLEIPAHVQLDSAELFNTETLSRKSRLTEGDSALKNLRFYGRVLVAEDSPANQLLIRKLLENYGLEVVLVSNGREAIDKALNEAFDLVFMDIQMPEMNGYEATYRIREQGGVLPIIALTANAMKGDEESCIKAGCDAYLSKPIQRDRLAALLRKFLVCSEVESDPSVERI